MIDKEKFHNNPLKAIGADKKNSLKELFDDLYLRRDGEIDLYHQVVDYLEKNQPLFKADITPFVRPVLLTFAESIRDYRDPSREFYDADAIREIILEDEEYSLLFLAQLLNEYGIKGNWHYVCEQRVDFSKLDNPSSAFKEIEFFIEEKTGAKLTFKQAVTLISQNLTNRLIIVENRLFTMLRDIPFSFFVENVVGGDDGEMGDYEIETLQDTLNGILG